MGSAIDIKILGLVSFAVILIGVQFYAQMMLVADENKDAKNMMEISSIILIIVGALGMLGTFVMSVLWMKKQVILYYIN